MKCSENVGNWNRNKYLKFRRGSRNRNNQKGDFSQINTELIIVSISHQDALLLTSCLIIVCATQQFFIHTVYLNASLPLTPRRILLPPMLVSHPVVVPPTRSCRTGVLSHHSCHLHHHLNKEPYPHQRLYER